MPFQSEKQRRYLWANEPEIARDWTDTYGHRAQGYDGGVMRVPFAEGKTSIPAWNLATLKQGLELATTQKEKDQIQSQIDRIEADIGTGADTLLGSGEAPTKGFWGKMSDMLGMSKAEGSIPTEKERIALMNSVQGNDIGNAWQFDPNHVRETIARYKMQKMMNEPQDIQTLDKSEFIDDANYIPKWNEYTDDPEYNEEEGEDYSVDQPKKGFRDYKTLQAYFADNPQFYQGIAQNLGRGIDKTRDRLGNIYQGTKDRGRQGLNLLGGAYQMLKGGFPLSLAFNAMPSFAYQGATSPAGGYSAAQQNQMNALGGYYSEPARQNRVLQDRRNYMLQRQREGKSYSDVNLGNVTAQLAANQGLSILNPNEMRNIQPTGGQGGIQDRGQTQGQRATEKAQRDDPGMGGHKKGGRVRFLEGGLASLWK